MWWLKESGFLSQGFQLQDSFKNNYPRSLRAVSLFSWSVEQNARDTQMTMRALVSRVSRLRRSTLARACTPLTKSEEKERLLAV